MTIEQNLGKRVTLMVVKKVESTYGSRYRTHRCVLRLGTGEGPAAPIPRADGKAEKGRGVSGRTLCGQVRQALCNYEGI